MQTRGYADKDADTKNNTSTGDKNDKILSAAVGTGTLRIYPCPAEPRYVLPLQTV